MVGIDKRRMSSKRVIKARKFQGATISHMYHSLPNTFIKEKNWPCNTLCWHKWRINYEGKEIVDKLLQLKSFIQENLPTTNVILSKPIMRVDTKQREKVVTDVNNKSVN